MLDQFLQSGTEEWLQELVLEVAIRNPGSV
jgi:hypothetical protein